MKKIVVIATSLLLVAGLSTYAQTEKTPAPKKSATTKAINPNPKATASPNTAAPQVNPGSRPKMSVDDSLKRAHKIDSIRKVIAERRGKEGFPILSKEDSMRRQHKIDSLKKLARERKQAGANGPQPYRPRMSKEDSLRRTHLMDSLRKAAEARQKQAPVKQEKK